MRSLLVAAAVTVPFAVGAFGASAADRDVAFSFGDAEILESSGLVVTDDLVITTNDSGDSARLFAVDPSNGKTLGTITYDASARDVEALAPAGGAAVWVGDIGDNLRKRDDIAVSRVPVGAADADVEAATYRLRFKGGPRDAEALLAHPVTGRLYVVSKTVLGGEFFAAPADLDPSTKNLLKPIGAAPGLVTDGAFFPDGRHLIVRNYGRAVVYAFPSLEVVGAFALPSQQQGEGIAVAPDGEIYLSSEGLHSEVLRLALPSEIRTVVQGSAEHPSPTTTNAPGPAGSEAADPDGAAADDAGSEQPDGAASDDAVNEQPDPRDARQWALGGIVAVVALVVLIRSLKPR